MNPLSLLFATNNPHKVSEIRKALSEEYQIMSLGDAGITAELPETSDTILENAIEKATFIKDHYALDCFAEDTGLEVDALGGAPGVYTARYAGPRADAQANMTKLLTDLEGIQERTARFRTVIALWLNDQLHTFEGTAEGVIADQPRGKGGFGYDPVFMPLGFTRTFAELGTAQKLPLSHRTKALQKLVAFLQQQKY